TGGETSGRQASLSRRTARTFVARQRCRRDGCKHSYLAAAGIWLSRRRAICVWLRVLQSQTTTGRSQAPRARPQDEESRNRCRKRGARAGLCADIGRAVDRSGDREAVANPWAAEKSGRGEEFVRPPAATGV